MSAGFFAVLDDIESLISVRGIFTYHIGFLHTPAGGGHAIFKESLRALLVLVVMVKERKIRAVLIVSKLMSVARDDNFQKNNIQSRDEILGLLPN
jgi:hypothetical protein